MEIIIDSREPPTMWSKFKQMGVTAKIGTLLIGDYQCGNVVIERKTIEDFANSMRYGHLQKQLLQMQEAFSKCYIVLVGDYENAVAFNPHLRSWTLEHHLGAISSILARYNVKIVQVKNDSQFIKIALKLFEKSLDGKTPDVMWTELMKDKMTTEDYELKMFCCIPNMGLKRAARLREKLNIKIIRPDGQPITEKYLQTIEGIGKYLAKELMKFCENSNVKKLEAVSDTPAVNLDSQNSQVNK